MASAPTWPGPCPPVCPGPSRRTGLAWRSHAMLAAAPQGHLSVGPGARTSTWATRPGPCAPWARPSCVVACTAFRSPSLEAVAQVLLPIAAFAETSGTFVNAEGAWQGFRGAVAPPGEARPGLEGPAGPGQSAGPAGLRVSTSPPRCARNSRALCTDAKPDNTPRGDLQALSPVGRRRGPAARRQRARSMPSTPWCGGPRPCKPRRLAVSFGVWLNAGRGRRARPQGRETGCRSARTGTP